MMNRNNYCVDSSMRVLSVLLMGRDFVYDCLIALGMLQPIEWLSDRHKL